MPTATYHERRGQLETYFDRTAAAAWSQLTSNAPVNKIRATVRAGRERMRSQLLDWLPADLTARRLLDAGCGTGALAIEAARRGAAVVAIDVSPTMVNLAIERKPAMPDVPDIDFRVGDMLDPALGTFDHVVAMDSLIHYRLADTLQVLETLGARTRTSILFTFAPKTPALTAMHLVGRLFPRGNRAPAIEPVAVGTLTKAIADHPGLSAWRTGRTQRVVNGFYTSHALELTRL